VPCSPKVNEKTDSPSHAKQKKTNPPFGCDFPNLLASHRLRI